MKGLGHDIRYALRQIHMSPGFAFAVILTLALGIGVNTAVFSMVNGFLLRPLPYPQPERLGVLLLHKEGISPTSGAFSGDNQYHDGKVWNWLKDNMPSAKPASYSDWTSGVNLAAGTMPGAEIRFVHEMRVSAHYFDVLGIPLLMGREFSEEEDRNGGAPAVILSYAVWHAVFHDDAHIGGKLIQLKGEASTVVGVLPPQVQTTQIADVWTPLQPSPTTGECEGYNCSIIMRLAAGATWQQVDAELSHLHEPFFDALATREKGRAWFHSLPMQKGVSRETKTPILLLMLAVSFILLIGCANLAGLTLVRMGKREAEIATRLSLGATRLGILRQLWVENFILALVGAATGLGLTIALLRFLKELLPATFVPIGGLTIDIRVLGFAAGASLLTSLLFGAVPAMQTRRVDLRPAMASSGRSVTGGSGQLRQWLIGAEVALTVVLLAGSGLLIHTLVYLETLPPGFDPSNVTTAKVSLDDARYHDAIAFQKLLTTSVSEMKKIPGVEDAAVGLSLPYERGLDWPVKILDGKLAGLNSESSAAYVTPGYFQTLRIPIVRGRATSESDGGNSEPVAVVNKDFVAKFFPEGDPLGRHIEVSGRAYRIIGVAANVAKKHAEEGNEPLGTERVFYLPASQASQGMINTAHVWFQPSWIARSSKPLEGLTGDMQKALAKADATLPFSGFYSMKDILAENLITQRAQVLLLGTLAGLALLLSAVGIYGLVSNLVVQRTREIGIRLALGAPLREVISKVGGSGVIASAAGLIVGLMLAAVSLRVLQSQLYGVRMYDPVTLTTVPVLLMLVAVAASLIPALRISRIDPAKTLRAE